MRQSMIVVGNTLVRLYVSVGSGRRTDADGGSGRPRGMRGEDTRMAHIGFAAALRATREAARIALERGWLPHSQN